MTNIANRFSFTPIRCAAALLSCALVVFATAHAALIPEPGTTFYGKVFDTTTGHAYQLHEGELTWVIKRSDGVNQILKTTLFNLGNGEFSYQLDVPHQVLSLGLSAEVGAVPLRAVDDEHAHLLISVNGRQARILGPSSASFDAAQVRRAATYRLDLAVKLNGADTDGNGIADWWEVKYNLNLPFADPDGDGWNNLTEFQKGTDPNGDNRNPTLETRELRAYADGVTLASLRALDSDSAASNIVYSVQAAPEVGTLFLRNASAGTGNPDQAITTGATFTQADVNAGRLIFAHPLNGDAEGTSFTVALHDEDPSHPGSTNTVAVLLYRPVHEVSASAITPAATGYPTLLPALTTFTGDEQISAASYLLSRERGYVVSDASAESAAQNLSAPSSSFTRAQYTSSYVPNYGAERDHIWIGSAAADRLVGGMANDILIGGAGNDTLRGNAGADLFLFTSTSDGSDTIEDFTPADNDVLDISRLLNGTSTLLTDYLQVTSTSSNTAFRLNFSGTGGSYSDAVITLSGVVYSLNDLYTLVDNGNLLTGNKSLPARIIIIASKPNASENGPTPGELTLTRSGSTASALTVNLQVSGSAANGSDYQFVSSQASFPAGVRTVVIPITPYADGSTELSEFVDVTVLSGTGYLVGSPSVAQVTIADLLPQLTIEALEPRAVRSDQYPGTFLVTRSGAIDRSVLVRFTVGGTAVNGTDYVRINSFLSMSANQNFALIDVTPTASANLTTAKSVLLTVKPDSAYFVGSPATAKVMLVQSLTSFTQWRSQYFPNSTSSLAAFAAEDPGNFHVPNFQRYAYALDAYAPDASRLPQPLLRDGYLTLDLWRRPDAADVLYSAAVSSNLFNWDSSLAAMQEINPALSTDPNVTSYRALPGMTNAPQLFFKVRLDYQP